MPPPTRADLFARTWRVLEGEEKKNEAALPTAYNELHRNSHKAKEQIDALAATVAASVDEAEAKLEVWADGDQGGEGPFSLVARYVIAARALERWYDPLVALCDVHHPLDGGRIEAWTSLVAHGRLNDDPALGSVILKRPRWGRWRDPVLGAEHGGGFRDVADFFGTLYLAPPNVEAGGPDDREEEESRMIRLAYKMLGEDALMVDPGRDDDVLVVGFAPLAEQPDDVNVKFLQREDGTHFYDVVAKDLSDRAAAAMATLVGVGANVVVFPEMAVSPDTLTCIKNKAAELGAASGSPLRLVVAGTTRVPDGEGGRPYNEAVLFNHRGEEIGRQRKLHRWNLNKDLRKIYGVQPDGGMPENEELCEYIEPGKAMCILESPRLGRLAVLICESLVRTKPGIWVVENMRLDWLFTPVLDRSLEPWRWTGKYGFKRTRAGRCRVVVANSMTLTLFANKVAGDLRKERQVPPLELKRYPVHDVGVGLCIDALDGEQSARCRIVSLRVADARVDAGDAACEAVRWEVDAWPNIDLRLPDQVAPGLFGRQARGRAGAQPIPEPAV